MRVDKLEIKRQAFHLALGLSVIFLLFKGILVPGTLFIILLISGGLSFLSLKFKIPIVSWFLRHFEREKALKTFPGKGFIFFLAGVLLVIKLFEKDIALAAIMILTMGDSVSHVIGRHIGRIKHPLNGLKSIEGTIAGIIAGFVGILGLIWLIPGFSITLLQAFFASLIAITLEAIELKMGGSAVDDNFIVPLVAGATIYLIQTNFGVFF